MNGIKVLTRLTLGLAAAALVFAGIGYAINPNFYGDSAGFMLGAAMICTFLGVISFIGLILALVITSIKGSNK